MRRPNEKENRMYITLNTPPRPDTSEVEPFDIRVTDQSCSPTPFTLALISAENRWTQLLTLSLSDKDFACLKEKVLAADEKRQAVKAAALATLKAELEPVIEAEPIAEWEKELLGGADSE